MNESNQNIQMILPTLTFQN